MHGIAKLHKRDCYKMTVAKILLNGQIYSKVYIGSSKIDENVVHSRSFSLLLALELHSAVDLCVCANEKW
jgi:hypothetical protein